MQTLLLVIISVCSAAGERRDASRPSMPPTPTAPRRSDEELVLDEILSDILNSPRFKSEREVYGTPGDKNVALVLIKEGGPPQWPPNGRPQWLQEYRPQIAGFTVHRNWAPSDGLRADKPRMLGVEIHEFDLKRPLRSGSGLSGGAISVEIFGAVGYQNGMVIGGCTVRCIPKRQNGKWVVECFPLFSS